MFLLFAFMQTQLTIKIFEFFFFPKIIKFPNTPPPPPRPFHFLQKETTKLASIDFDNCADCLVFYYINSFVVLFWYNNIKKKYLLFGKS